MNEIVGFSDEKLIVFSVFIVGTTVDWIVGVVDDDKYFSRDSGISWPIAGRSAFIDEKIFGEMNCENLGGMFIENLLIMSSVLELLIWVKGKHFTVCKKYLNLYNIMVHIRKRYSKFTWKYNIKNKNIKKQISHFIILMSQNLFN